MNSNFAIASCPKPFSLLLAFVLGSASLLAADEPASVKHLSAAEAIKLVGEPGTAPGKPPPHETVTVLDVRTPAEFTAGHIKSAVNIDFRAPDFEKRLVQLDKNRPYLVHCAGGGRSSKVRDLMAKLGFRKINHLDGGLTAWEKAGGAIEKKPAVGKK